jgi:transposase
MEHYIGVDFHMQHSSVAVMDKDGAIKDERKLYHADTRELIDYFSSFDKDTSVALEATRNWYWFVDLLQELELNVKLVHAKKVRIIAESTIKTDKIDARILAHLDRCSFLPTAYIAGKETRSQRELLRYYMNLVRLRASVKNRVHAILAKNNIHHVFSDLFGNAGTLFLKELSLPPIFRMELDGYLNVLENLKAHILEAKKEIEKTCKDLKYVQRLITTPGISYFTGLLLASEIADIARFSTFKKLCCYAGLASRTRQSADTTRHGHIVKDSNKYIRYALIEAVPTAVRKDQRLLSFYTKIRRQKGVNKARIATARKLLIAIYFMLKNNTDYRIADKYYTQANPKTKLGAHAAL